MKHPLVVCSLLCAGGLPAQRSLLDQLPPEQEAAAFRVDGFGDDLTPVALPGAGQIRGLAKVGDSLWLLRDGQLLDVAWPAATLRAAVAAPANAVALTADERFVYVLTGREIAVFDPLAGMVVRSIALASLWPPTAFAAHAGALHVVDRDGVVVVDKRTGAAAPGPRVEGHLLQWLASDGEHLLGGDGVDCMLVGGGGAAVRRWPVLLQHGRAAWVDGKLLLSAQHVDRHRGPTAVLGFVQVDATRPREVLVVRITGKPGELRLHVGPRTFASLEVLQQELRRIAADPSHRVPTADGRTRPLRVELEPQAGVLVRDVKAVWEAVVTSGFPVVSCPTQEAWLREQARAKRAPAPPAERQEKR